MTQPPDAPNTRLGAIVAKWAAVPDLDEPALDLLRAGRLAEAQHAFEALAGTRGGPRELAGLGDLAAARDDWLVAGELYQRARELDPADPVARMGISQVLVATGQAAAAVAELEDLFAQRPEDPVCRHFLVSALAALTVQVRDLTPEGVLVFGAAETMTTCERAARRILELDVPDAALNTEAQRLLAEVAASRQLGWRGGPAAIALIAVIAVAGLCVVATGAAARHPGVVITASLAGALLLWLVTTGLRQPVWRLRAAAAGTVRWQGSPR